MVCGSFFFLSWTLSELSYNTYYYTGSRTGVDSSSQLLHAHYLTKFALIIPIIHTISITYCGFRGPTNMDLHFPPFSSLLCLLGAPSHGKG